MSRLPLDFPPLVEMAERAANEVHGAAMLVVLNAHGSVASSIGPSAVTVAAHARLLSDLTRPESQAVWLRWLAERVGVPAPAVGAPEWKETTHRGLVSYEIGSGIDSHDFALGWTPREGTPCPALPGPDSTDAPLRALALAIVTVAGGAR